MTSIRTAKTDSLVKSLRLTSEYKDKFTKVLPRKVDNELAAKNLIENNLGKLSKDQLKEILTLVDEPYNQLPPWNSGIPPQWFGKLIKMNGIKMLDESTEKINRWFSVIVDKHMPAEVRIARLSSHPYKISGAATGLITLMIYVLDKANYSIWFGPMHDGLREFYPEIGGYTGKAGDYKKFNQYAKALIREYGFNDTELDYLLTAATRLKNRTIS